MSTQLQQILSDIYCVNPDLDPQQLSNAFIACLCKAEALALTAATVDFEAFSSETFNNYMWALSDYIREAKVLYEKAKLVQI